MTIKRRIYANNAKTTLASVVSETDTEIQVASTAGFKAPGPGEYFLATIDGGSTIEIIEVHGIVGNSFTGCVRGKEGTTAQSFLIGTRIENRVTAGTLESFARKEDRLGNISSVDELDPPSQMDGNTYVCASSDDAGNPIVAIADQVTGVWKFVNHGYVLATGVLLAESGTQGAIVPSVVPVEDNGSYIIQFTSGINKGRARLITAVNGSQVVWDKPLPVTSTPGDAYAIYQSTTSILARLSAASENAVVYSILFSE